MDWWQIMNTNVLQESELGHKFIRKKLLNLLTPIRRLPLWIRSLLVQCLDGISLYLTTLTLGTIPQSLEQILLAIKRDCQAGPEASVKEPA